MVQALHEARTHPGEVIVLFTDEASFYRQPSQARLWFWMGRKQPKLRYSHRANTVMRVVGTLDAVSGEVLTWDFSRVTASRLSACWLEAAKSYPEAKTIYLVMDNWPVHFHEKAQTAVARDPRLQILPLPTYAPWLNNIEKLWRWVKQRVTHAHPWCDDFQHFKEQVREEFQRLASGSPALRRYCGLDNLFSL